jgi:hydrogenase expression/formation protein HypC
MCLGVPGQITKIYTQQGFLMGRIDFGGVFREACLEYVPEAQVGDYVLIHVGFALNVISSEEAEQTIFLLQQIGEYDQEAGSVP